MASVFEGMRHGHLTVIREVERDGKSIRRYECRCDCGKIVVLRSNHFYPTRLYCSQQCTFLSRKREIDLLGRTVEGWTAISKAGKNQRCTTWNCVCECGTQRVLPGEMLLNGGSKCCGCRNANPSGRTPEEKIEVRRLRCRLANQKNPARVKAAKIKYETQRDTATPPWVTEEELRMMNDIYEEARRLTRETGVHHQVDHIVPLQGKTVSGLHVFSNLQILTQVENVSKSNRYAELLGD